MSQLVEVRNDSSGQPSDAPLLNPPDWSSRAGMMAWPTLVQCAFIITGYGLSTWAAWVGRIPLLAGALFNLVLAYLAFTPLHDASHGAVVGRHERWRWLESLVGWISGCVLIAPFSAFKVMHLRHHGHTNDPEHDPDFWVARNRWWKTVLGCLTILPHYVVCFLFNPSRATEKHRSFGIVMLTVFLTLPVTTGLAAGAEAGLKVIALYTVPGWLALALLAFFFDYLPHHPFNRRDRFYDTRVILFPGFGLLTMNQSYHLIHHLWPRIPFYHYSTFFYEARPFLEQRECFIITIALNEKPETMYQARSWPFT